MPESCYLFWPLRSRQGVTGSESAVKARVLNEQFLFPAKYFMVLSVHQPGGSVLIQGRMCSLQKQVQE